MTQFDRRGFIRAGSIFTFGFLSYGDALRLRADTPSPQTKAKVDPREVSVIHLLLGGGMSHQDTFDMKAEAKSKYRSPFQQIPTSVPGLRVCEHLPLTAKLAHKYFVIRSMTHKAANHDIALNLMLTGHEQIATVDHPTMGSIVGRELGPRNELPAFVGIPGASVEPGGRAGFLGSRYNPFHTGDPNKPDWSVRDLNLPMGVEWSRMEGRFSLKNLVESRIRTWDTSDAFETLDSYYQSALNLMRSPAARNAFDMAQEPEAMRERYGRTTMGQGALLARRLVEARVRFVTVCRGFNAWDHHANLYPAMTNDFLPDIDRAFSALIEDLDQRGLLATTLVVLSGEFGPTPKINVNGGRDHWPNCFSVVLAGAGIPGGGIYGESDADGMFVKDNPVQVPDFTATLYNKLGIDYTKENHTGIGRPIRISDGKPLSFLS